jgi:hypothetical protein
MRLHGGAGGFDPEKWILLFMPGFGVLAPEQMGHGRTGGQVPAQVALCDGGDVVATDKHILESDLRDSSGTHVVY